MKYEEKAGWVAPQGAGGAGDVDDDRAPGAEFARDARLVGWLVAAVAAFALVTLTGCGSKRSDQRITDSDAGAGVSADVFGIAQAAADTGTGSVALQGSEPAAVPSDSLPPDVVASASEADVVPGGTVEVEARTSADVTEVFLADGIGRRQSFAFDSAAGLWRARYRVPLGVTADRLGVSVTARNGLDLRHRVWVFLRIEREPRATPPATQPQVEETQTPG